MDMKGPSRTDRAWAWAGALVAAGVSIAVNVAHAAPHTPTVVERAELIKAGAAVPEIVGSWGFAAFAAVLPIMVLISAEQMARRLLGAATWPVMLVIGLSAYSLSFWHTVLLLGAWGEPWPLRLTGAVAVDGLAVGSVVALYIAGRRASGDVPDIVMPVRPDSGPSPAVRPDVRTVPGDTMGEASAPDVHTRPFVLPDALRPPVEPVRPDVRPSDASVPDARTPDAEPVRLINGSTRPAARTALAERPPRTSRATDDVWTRFDQAAADGHPWSWIALGTELGINPEAARKRAERRARRMRADAQPNA